MASAAEDLVAAVRLLVDRPAAVRAEERAAGVGSELILSVDASDRGKVIGRRGRTIDALRALARIRGQREGRELDLDLVDD